MTLHIILHFLNPRRGVRGGCCTQALGLSAEKTLLGQRLRPGEPAGAGGGGGEGRLGRWAHSNISLSASLSKCSLSSYCALGLFSLLKRSHKQPRVRGPDEGWRPPVSCGPTGHNDTCYLVSQRSREATSEFRQMREGCSHPQTRAVEQRPLPAWDAQGPSLLGCPSRPPALGSSLVPLSLIVRVCSQRSWSILPTARGKGEELARCRKSARPHEREGHRDLWLWGRRRAGLTGTVPEPLSLNPVAIPSGMLGKKQVSRGSRNLVCWGSSTSSRFAYCVT